MAGPGLTDLPTEVLEEIVQNATPEGFESLALTCRVLHQSCIPFIERHNHLRLQFQDFAYTKYPLNRPFPPNPSAFELTTHIANEPEVACYIRNANFYHDTWPPRTRRLHILPAIDQGGPIVELFENSPYFVEAGLGWKDYYALIQEELEERTTYRYSQLASTFLLNLLPNVESLHLPKLWAPSERSENILGAIVRKAIAQRNSPWGRPSLVQLTRFEPEEPGSSSEFGSDHSASGTTEHEVV